MMSRALSKPCLVNTCAQSYDQYRILDRKLALLESETTSIRAALSATVVKQKNRHNVIDLSEMFQKQDTLISL